LGLFSNASLSKIIRCKIVVAINVNTYWQYLQTDGLPFPRSNNRLMLMALLLLTTGLTMGATQVVTLSNVLEPPGQVACALVGAGTGAGVSSSSEDEVSML
jgi:hypothetical protein